MFFFLRWGCFKNSSFHNSFVLFLHHRPTLMNSAGSIMGPFCKLFCGRTKRCLRGRPQELHSMRRSNQAEDFLLHCQLDRDKNRNEQIGSHHLLTLARFALLQATAMTTMWSSQLSFWHIYINRNRAEDQRRSHVDMQCHILLLRDRTLPILSCTWDSNDQVSWCNVLGNTVIPNTPTYGLKWLLCYKCVWYKHRPHLPILFHQTQPWNCLQHKILYISICSRPSTGHDSLTDCCRILSCLVRWQKYF